jgi:predicted transcriptional regulator
MSEPTVHTSIRLGERFHRLLGVLAAHLGMTRRATIEQALREKAAREKVKT